MEQNLTIKNFDSVFEGEFCPSKFKKKNIGRQFDGFIYLVYGEIEYIFDSYSFTVKDNDIFYLSKNSNYEIDVRKNSKYICINFNFSENNNNRESRAFRDIPHEIKNKFEKSLQLWLSESPWMRTEIMSIIYHIYSSILKSLNKKYTNQGKIYSKIIKYVLTNYTNADFTVQKLADAMNMSECHLRRIFRSQLNTSPIKYINYLRLEKAKTMLAESNYTIENIVFSSGFNDYYYFNRVFKKEIGISPLLYRKKMHNYDEL